MARRFQPVYGNVEHPAFARNREFPTRYGTKPIFFYTIRRSFTLCKRGFLMRDMTQKKKGTLTDAWIHQGGGVTRLVLL